MAVFVPACLERDFDAQTGTCSAPIWIPQPSLLPGLTVADAQSIGQAIVLLWAVAFVFRLIRKVIQRS
ncbi:hypothetical protein [Xanthomonas theicola]|uniref:Phage coat protein n=1 Tax=Xanthomonas theicola TaxID=56464 RepID=A0A2S6YZJ7_9XANT|nr:hypothetical protein [Xanthomonas theicola]PPT73493.1 hypothetical protein XthCFBP4691_20190 [Xanthomonas theicola]QNH24708.1 hypothetical protein G4Q83_08095 [Xanthomonas theicola]